MYYLAKNKEEFDERMKRVREDANYIGRSAKTFTALYSDNLIKYIPKGILSLYEHQDVKLFKKYMDLSAKSLFLSRRREHWCIYGTNVENFFSAIMSDNILLREFLINNIDVFCYEEKVDNHRGLGGILFLNRNTLLALKGDWEALKRRSIKFLEDTPTKYKKKSSDYEFFLALSQGNVEKMKEALSYFADTKNGRNAAKETIFSLELYLQPQLLMYAKIASIHGYDLGIDLDIAPKELIEYKPLSEKEYEANSKENELLKKYAFKASYSEWIEYMSKVEEEYLKTIND